MTTQQLLSPLRKAVEDFKMIKRGDKIAVGLSGGKDSGVLLQLALQCRAEHFPGHRLGVFHFDYEAQYPSQAEQINAELTKIGRFDVSLSSYDGVYQAEFIADGVWYVIGTNDPAALQTFVAALGE